MPNPDIDAVLFDFGGVILSSPFEAFRDYEREHGLPADFLRGLNATNPDTNAWARLERGEVDVEQFCELFEAEAAAAGHRVAALDVLALLRGEPRPAMLTALRRCHEHYKTGLLTNNFGLPQAEAGSPLAEVLSLLDVVVESSSARVRKPDPAFYLIACERLDIRPERAVFLDDLGINLKPARELGMHTIKVVDPDAALAELEALLDLPLRG